MATLQSETTPCNQVAEGTSGASSVRRVLDLGCGTAGKIPGAVRVDVVPDTNPDIVHNLDEFPWPIESDSFDTIYCLDVIEHLADIVRTIEEIHRIARAGARVHLATPHYSCANSYTDPTHRHHLGFFSFDYFTGQNQWNFYTKVRFKKVASRLHFYGRYKNLHVSWFANRWPRCYEEHWAWIFPAWYMSFELEVLK